MKDVTTYASHIKADFGGEERSFALPWASLEELEEITGPIFVLLRNVLQLRAITVRHGREVVRLALIGGGMDPNFALALVRRYYEERPSQENVELVCLILEAACFGSPEYQKTHEVSLTPEKKAEIDQLKAAAQGGRAPGNS